MSCPCVVTVMASCHQVQLDKQGIHWLVPPCYALTPCSRCHLVSPSLSYLVLTNVCLLLHCLIIALVYKLSLYDD